MGPRVSCSEGGGWLVPLSLPTSLLCGAEGRSWVCFSEQQTRLPTEDGGRAEVGEASSVREQGYQILIFLLQQETSGVCDARDRWGWPYFHHMSHTHPTHTHPPPYITHAHAYTLHTSSRYTYTHITHTQLTHPLPCTHITNTHEGSPGKALLLSWLTSLGTAFVRATLGRSLSCLLSQQLVRVGRGQQCVLAGSENV